MVIRKLLYAGLFLFMAMPAFSDGYSGFRIWDTTATLRIAGDMCFSASSITWGTCTLRINGTSGADSFFNTGGNVGIGITTPDKKLYVQSSAATYSMYIKNTHATDGDGLRIIAGDGIDESILFLEDKDGTDRHRFLADGSVYLAIGGGNVGIGDIEPDGTLHVQTAGAGAVTAQSNADDLVVENGAHAGISILVPNNQEAAIRFGNINSNVAGGIRYRGPAMASGISSMVFETSTTEKMRIQADGNVGIGTTSPAGLLGIGSDLFIVKSGGNVGIGNVAPDARFKINSNVAETSYIVLVSSQNDLGLFSIRGDGIIGVQNQPLARGFLETNDQSVPTATFTKILLNAENYDNHDEFSTTGSSWTAKVGGTYLVVIGALFEAMTAGDRCLLCIYKNDALYSAFNSGSAVNSNWTVNFTEILVLNANDALSMWVYHDNGANIDIKQFSYNTFLVVTKLY